MLLFKLIRMLVGFLLSVATLLAPAHAETWLPSGIGGGGGLEQPSISPHDPNTVYMSSDMSGVYKTINFGKDWTLLPYRNGDATRQEGITDRGRSSPFQFTDNANIVYATNRETLPPQIVGTDAQQVVYPVKSIDGGATFSKIAEFGLRVFADPSNSNRVLFQTGNEIKYSSNGGADFLTIDQLKIPDYVSGVLFIAGVNWNSNSVVVATNFGLREFNPKAASPRFYARGNTGIFSSGGKSIATFSSVKLSPATNGAYRARFYAVTYPTSLGWDLSYPRIPQSHTTNQVEVYAMNWVQGIAPNWTPTAQWSLVSSYPDDFLPYWVKTSQSNPDIVYLAGIDKTPWQRPAVMRSSNRGVAWQSILNTDNCNNSGSCTNVNIGIKPGWAAAGSRNSAEIGGIDWGWGSNLEGIAVDPNNAERVMITTNTVHVTQDASAGNWTQAYNKQKNQNPANKPIQPHDSTKRYSTNGVEPTMTHWLAWNRGKMLAAMTDMYGMFSDNNGSSWRNIANNLTLARNMANTENVGHGNIYRIAKSKFSGKRLYAATSSVNDIYQAHDRLIKFEEEFQEAGHSSCWSNSRIGAVGSIHKSNNSGETWAPVKWFTCPAVWVETKVETIDGAETEVLYVSLVHSQHGGIFKVVNPNSPNPTVTQLLSQQGSPYPNPTAGNPNNIYALKDSYGATQLLTSWGVKLNTSNNFVGSGLYKYSNNQWQAVAQPPAMNTHTRNIVIDPKNDGIWFAAAFNKFSKFKLPTQSNAVSDGGGGIFRFSNDGANWVRITPPSIYRAESIAINPEAFSKEAYVTTADNGLWKTTNVYAASPKFTRVAGFPYRHALRVFYAPDNSVWVTTFGGGLFKLDDERNKIGAVVTVPAGTSSAAPITDNNINNPQNHWSNGGNASKKYIDLNLQERHAITNIFYADVWSKQLKISIFDGIASPKIVFASGNPKADGLSKTDIPIDNIFGDRVRIEVLNGSYMQTIEAKVHGVMLEADFASIQTIPAANQSKIADGDNSTAWNNRGNPANAIVGLVLDKKRTVFNIKYTDRWRKILKIRFFNKGLLVHELTKETVNGNGTPTTTDISVPDIPTRFVSIREVGTPNQGVRWMTPTEIDVFGWPE